MITEMDKAYLAGLMDGEGHVGITLLANQNGMGRHTLVVTITNRDIAVLRDLAALWGARVVGVRQRNAKWSRCGDIRWNTNAAVQILTAIQPYLRIKKQQASIALLFAATIRPPGHHTIPLSNEEWGQREKLRYQIQLLNSRKPEPPRNMGEKPELICQQCGLAFNSYQKRRRYCSTKCSMAAGRDTYNQRNHLRQYRSQAIVT